MSFCSKCGTQLSDDVSFCSSCGNPVSQQAQPQMQYRQPIQFQQPIYGYVKPTIPGRGLGITGMILGIISFIVGLIFAVNAIDAASTADKYNVYGYIHHIVDYSGDMIACVFLSSLSILAFIFAAVGRSKGYRGGVSVSGITMSVFSLFCFVIAIVVYATI